MERCELLTPQVSFFCRVKLKAAFVMCTMDYLRTFYSMPWTDVDSVTLAVQEITGRYSLCLACSSSRRTGNRIQWWYGWQNYNRCNPVLLCSDCHHSASRALHMDGGVIDLCTISLVDFRRRLVTANMNKLYPVPGPTARCLVCHYEEGETMVVKMPNGQHTIGACAVCKRSAREDITRCTNAYYGEMARALALVARAVPSVPRDVWGVICVCWLSTMDFALLTVGAR